MTEPAPEDPTQTQHEPTPEDLEQAQREVSEHLQTVQTQALYSLAVSARAELAALRRQESSDPT